MHAKSVDVDAAAQAADAEAGCRNVSLRYTRIQHVHKICTYIYIYIYMHRRFIHIHIYIETKGSGDLFSG